MISILTASNRSDFKQIEDLAKIIWTQHYTPIIGSEQVSYMLQKFQSTDVIALQIKEGTEYAILYFKEQAVGYYAVVKKNEDLFLSKFYILKTHRGKGIGKVAMKNIEVRSKALGCSCISLTVNKYNTNSIKAYEKMGFIKIKAIVQDIGNDFVMDDFLMKKEN